MSVPNDFGLMMRRTVGLARKATGSTVHRGGRGQTLFWWARSHSVVERQGKGSRKVSPSIGGSDAVCVATELACRGMRRDETVS